MNLKKNVEEIDITLGKGNDLEEKGGLGKSEEDCNISYTFT